MNEPGNPDCGELKRRLKLAEDALRAIREGQADTIMDDGRHLVVRLAESEAREAHLKQVLMAIRNVNQLIASEGDPKQLIERACANMTETLGYLNAWIALLDEKGQTVTMTGDSGFPPGFDEMKGRLKRGVFPSCIKRALEDKGLVVIREPVSECPDCPLAMKYAGRSGMTHRLEHEGRVFGTLSVSVPLAFAGDEVEHSLFVEMAGDLAFALYKVELLAERNKAEAALRGSHEMLSMAERIANVGSWEWECDIDQVYWSEELFRFFGMDPAAGAPSFAEHSQLYVEEDIRRLRKAVEACLARGKPYEMELRAIRNDGEIRQCMVRGQALTGAEGGVERLVGSLQDITERKKQENRIALLGRMIDSAPAAITIHNDEGCFFFANRRTLELHGYENEEDFLTVNLHELDVPESEELLPDRFRRIKEQGGARFEAAHYRKDGSTFPLEVLAKAIEWEGRPAVLSIASDITERKQAEAALRESEERFRTLFESLSSGSCVDEIVYENGKAVDYRILDVNPSYEKIMGISRREAVNSLGSQLYGTGGAPFLEILARVAETGEPERFESFFEPIQRHLELTVSRPAQGLFSTVFSDITERKQAEAALRESEERFRRLLNELHMVPVQGYGPDGTILFWNEGSHILYGYSQEEAAGKNLLDLIIPPGIRGEVLAGIQRMAATGKPLPPAEVTLMRKDGTPVQVYSSHCILQLTGCTRELYCVDVDLSAIRQAEVEMTRLTSAVEQAEEMFVITDAEGTIQYVNPAFERVTGYSREETVGRNPRFLKSGEQDGEFYRRMWDTLTSGRAWSGRMVNRRKDGSLYTEESVISPVRDSAGNTVHYAASQRDITENLRTSEMLQQAQKMESVGRLAGGVAHDFNNMLNVILGHAEMALETLSGDIPLRADLEEIQKAAQRSAALTRQLLAFARRQTVAPRILELNDTLEGMLEMIRRLIGEDIELSWLPGAGLWPVEMDPSQMDQVLANLCVNARDAISGVGKISIETGNVSLNDDYSVSHPGFVPGEYVMLAVSDDGSGMDQETLDHVFEPFFTTKELGKGTGLGLATVYGIVKQNSGFIYGYSEPGLGTTFKLYFPRLRRETDQEDAAPVTAVPSGRGERILLVEDEKAIVDLGRRMLEKLGYQVLAADSPGEAMRLAGELSGTINLLVTDVVMPEMNGQDLALRIKALYPDLKVLFMSGYTANVIAHRGVLDKGVNFIQKPFSQRELAVKVRKVLDLES